MRKKNTKAPNSNRNFFHPGDDLFQKKTKDPLMGFCLINGRGMPLITG